MNDLGRASGYIARASQIAFVLLVAVLAGVFGGYWRDQGLGTIPIFLLVAFAIGTTGGAIGWWGLSV